MVPGRQDIDPKIKKFTDDVRCQAKTCSSIFTVGDHQVDHMLINQARQQITDKLSPGATDNITNKKDFQKQLQGLKRVSTSGKWGNGISHLPISTISRTTGMTRLFSVVSCSRLTNDVDPDLAGVGHFVLDLASDIFCHDMRLVV